MAGGAGIEVNPFDLVELIGAAEAGQVEPDPLGRPGSAGW